MTSQSEQRGAELLFDVISNSRISYFSYADGCACVSFCVTLGSIRRKLTIFVHICTAKENYVSSEVPVKLPVFRVWHFVG